MIRDIIASGCKLATKLSDNRFTGSASNELPTGREHLQLLEFASTEDGGGALRVSRLLGCRWCFAWEEKGMGGTF